MRNLIVEDEFKIADVIASRLRKLHCRRIRRQRTSFNNGANDYLTKPFHIDELVARVNAQLRMNNVQAPKDYIEAGNLKLNLKNSTLICTTTNKSSKRTRI